MRERKNIGKLEIKAWKEGRNILIRCDKYHINTQGRNLKQAFESLADALSIHEFL